MVARQRLGPVGDVRGARRTPRSDRNYKRILAIYRAHIEGVLRYQDAEGYWRNLLDRKDSARESSGAAIFTYCLARGVSRGWLPLRQVEEPLRRAGRR